MLEVFIAILLFIFLGLFMALSFPMKGDEPKRRETAPTRPQHSE